MLGRIFHLIRAILAPALLGVGTIFQAKVRADDHWSTSPKIAMLREVESEASGEPPDEWPQSGSERRLAQDAFERWLAS
jgi:hypothetical protein